jgi:hypothetical protein
VRRWARRFAPIGPVILIVAFLFVPGVSRWFWDAVFAASAMIGLDARLASIGFVLFQFWR